MKSATPRVLAVLALVALSCGGAWPQCEPEWAGNLFPYGGVGGRPCPTYCSYYVSVLCVYNDELYAWGSFAFAGLVLADDFAKWDGESWHNVGPGMNGAVSSACVYKGELYAGGSFTRAGGVNASNIAKWDGLSWQPVGTGITGTNASVSALFVYNDELYAGGSFTTAGGVAAKNIAKWDGASWQPVEFGLNGAVSALCVYNDELYATGAFTAAGRTSVAGIAKWDGVSWQAIGSGTVSGVCSLCVYGDELYAGGAFSAAGGVPANNIARWDGVSWQAIGAGVSRVDEPSISSLCVYGGKLYVAGFFTTAGGAPAWDMARWNGTSWEAIGTGVAGYEYPHIYALCVYDDELYVAGQFTSAGDASAINIAKWDGSTWKALTSSVNGLAYTTAVYNGEFYGAGWFRTAEEDYGVARWDGDSWEPTGPGMDDSVEALAVYNGELYAGGKFTTADGAAANHIARWDGVSWQGIGVGMDDTVESLCVYKDELYAGGAFTAAGGTEAHGVARWNGLSWQAAGTGPGAVYVRAGPMIVYNGELHVAGSFDWGDGAWVSGIGKYDGSSWKPIGMLGTGFADCLAVYNGELFAGGGFSSLGGVYAPNIARWNGVSWKALGQGVYGHEPYEDPDRVYALCVHDGELYVGGSCICPERYIARWDGASWHSVGGGMDNRVLALWECDNGTGPGPALYATGDFNVAGGVASAYMARWGCTDTSSSWLAVRIDQAPSQAEPASALPVNFRVVFSRSVDDFATGDVALSGTAGATTAIVTGSGTTYNVAVSGVTGSGTVIASIPPGVAHDEWGNLNLASTSTDNEVLFNRPPSTSTLAPTSAKVAVGVKQTFKAVYRDGDGYPDLKGCYLLFDTILVGKNACYVVYDYTTNKLYLRNDTNTGWLGGFAPRSAEVIENSQCRVYCAECAVAGSGSLLTVWWRIEFKQALANKTAPGTALKAWMLVSDKNGVATSWALSGSYKWLTPVNLTPANAKLAVASRGTFREIYRDESGYPDIKECHLLFNTILFGKNACWVMYDYLANKLYLRNDANTAWLGGFAPRSAEVIENSQCRVYCAESTVAGSGSLLTVWWRIEFKQALANNTAPGTTLKAWMLVSDKNGAATNWALSGSYKWLTPVSLAPANAKLAVASEGTFKAVYRDDRGYPDLKECHLLFNTILFGKNACWVMYDYSANKLYLRNDTNTGWLGGFAPRSAEVIENSQCRVYCAECAVAGSGSLLTVWWRIEFKQALANKTVPGTTLKAWTLVSDKNGASSGWALSGEYRWLSSLTLAPSGAWMRVPELVGVGFAREPQQTQRFRCSTAPQLSEASNEIAAACALSQPPAKVTT